MGKNEVKLLAIILYYVFVGVIVLIFFTYFLQSEIEKDLNDLILCKTVGNEDCQIKATITNVRSLSTIFAISGAFVPVVIILFSFDIDNFQEKIGRKKVQAS